MLSRLLLVLQATTQLGTPERTLPVDFTQVRGVRELADGRILVTDRLDQGLVVADFAKGTVARIGRTGSGPAEYRLPTALIAMPGDSTLLVDEGNQRLAVVGPDLKIHRSFNLMLPGIGPPLGARAADRQGRYILQIPGWIHSLPGDTLLVVRFDPRSQRVDTLARVKGSTPRKNTMIPGLPYVIFAAQDVWQASLDGRVAVARSGDYHVDWIGADGRVVRGARIPFQSRPVSMDDRIAHVRKFLENSSISGRDAAGGLSPLPQEMLEPDAVRKDAETQEHAATHPPFTETTPHIDATGAVWVERSMPLGRPQTWDVIGATGTLVGRIGMPKGRRLAALSARWLYAVATDEDGLQRVERYRLPVLSAGRGRAGSEDPCEAKM